MSRSELGGRGGINTRNNHANKIKGIAERHLGASPFLSPFSSSL